MRNIFSITKFYTRSWKRLFVFFELFLSDKRKLEKASHRISHTSSSRVPSSSISGSKSNVFHYIHRKKNTFQYRLEISFPEKSSALDRRNDYSFFFELFYSDIRKLEKASHRISHTRSSRVPCSIANDDRSVSSATWKVPSVNLSHQRSAVRLRHSQLVALVYKSISVTDNPLPSKT
jgi:hypothetical protein